MADGGHAGYASATARLSIRYCSAIDPRHDSAVNQQVFTRELPELMAHFRGKNISLAHFLSTTLPLDFLSFRCNECLNALICTLP